MLNVKMSIRIETFLLDKKSCLFQSSLIFWFIRIKKHRSESRFCTVFATGQNHLTKQHSCYFDRKLEERNWLSTTAGFLHGLRVCLGDSQDREDSVGLRLSPNGSTATAWAGLSRLPTQRVPSSPSASPAAFGSHTAPEQEHHQRRGVCPAQQAGRAARPGPFVPTPRTATRSSSPAAHGSTPPCPRHLVPSSARAVREGATRLPPTEVTVTWPARPLRNRAHVQPPARGEDARKNSPRLRARR